MSSRDGCSKCGGAHFQRDCCARKITGKQSSGKRQTEQVMAKERVTKTRRKSKGKSKGTKGAIQGAKGSHKGKTSKTGLSGLENSKSETSSVTQETGHVFPDCME